MNESLCNEDKQKQAHLDQVDFYIKRLFSFNRLPVDVFEKLMALREEDGEFLVQQTSKAPSTNSGLKDQIMTEISGTQSQEVDKFADGEGNFFLQSQNANSGDLDLNLKEGEGYDEVEATNQANIEGQDDQMQDIYQEEQAHHKTGKGGQRIDVEDIFDCRNLSQAELQKRQQRYERECAMGYFLQPIYVQKLKQKIYFYDDLVRQMESEFKQRVQHKRDTILKMRHKMKEHALTEASLICERCNADIAPMRTFDFIHNDLHYAKCVFGTLKRIELPEAQSSLYDSDRDFIDLYLEDYDNLRSIIKKTEKTQPKDSDQA